MRRAIAFAIYIIAGLFGVSAARADGLDPASGVPPPAPTGGGLGVGLTLGTTGIGGELSVRPFGNLVLRANGSWLALEHDFDVDDNTYNLKADMVSAGGTIDWHPFANGFRLSAGARYHNVDLAGKGAFTGTFELNGTTYDLATTGPINATVQSANTIAPYVGIGYDSTHFSDSRWAVAIDVGVIFAGKPKTTLTAENADTVPGLQADLDAEAKELQDSVGKYGQFWPVATLALKYRF